jgi:hypothetical protein
VQGQQRLYCLRRAPQQPNRFGQDRPAGSKRRIQLFKLLDTGVMPLIILA